jgi:hypothetical protein
MSHEPNGSTAHCPRLLRSRSWLAPPTLALALVVVGCGAGPSPAPAPPCDPSCQDGVALLGVRSAMKLAYNIEIAAHPVGAQDATTPCISFDGTMGGSVHIFGTVTVDPEQGASIISATDPLSYDFKNCLYSAAPDPTADQNFSLTLTGLVTETGTLAVQPTANTALLIQSDSLTVSGTVYDPPVDYAASSCALSVDQNGNDVAGAFCGRAAGFMF